MNRAISLIGAVAFVLARAPPTSATSGTLSTTSDTSAGRCIRPPSGLTGWWPGDGNTDDIVGGRDAVLHGDATFGPGAVGSARATSER